MEPDDSQALLLGTLDHLPLVIFRRSMQNFEMEYLSSGIVPLLHSPLKDFLGTGYTSRIELEDQEFLRQKLEQARDSGASYQTTYRIAGRWVSEYGQRDGSSLAGHLHFTELGLQAAEQRRQQLELEHKLRVVFESSDVMNFLLTPEHRVYESSQGMRPFFREQPRGQCLLELLGRSQNQSVVARFQAALHQAAQGYTQTFEVPLDQLELQVTLSPIVENGQVQFYFGTCLDITERNANRDYVRHSEQNLQALFRATAAAMIVVRGGVVVQCNPAALSLLGVSLEREVQQRQISDFLPEDQQAGSFESDLQRPDGVTLRVEVTITPLVFGGELHLLYGCYNLTAQKQIQEALQAAMETAENANRAKSTFLATMSHEIRTPLNGIIGLLHLARQSQDRERQLEYLEKLERAAQGLLRIINDVLDFSKIEAGQLHLEIDDFELDSILDQVTHMISVWSKDKPHLHAYFDVQPGLPRSLRGDSLRLTQILMNLCSNAVKFTQQGEIKVEVRKRAEDDSTVLLEFSVSDTGIGMSSDHMLRTFVPFSQADSSTTRLYGGTGLGLFITKRFVELLGGSIEVNSQLGKGSQFTFTARFGLPLGSTGTHRLDGLKVLVLDENETSSHNFQSVLSRLGCTANLMKTAEQALFLPNHAAYEVVVLDGRLEQAGEIFQCLKIHEGLKSAIFLMLTRVGEKEELQHAYGLGFDGVMTKPVTDVSFCQAIEGARLRRRNNQALLAGSTALLGEGHVLLVEDNDINQEVASEILRLLGLRVTVAATGQEALDALMRDQFDAVLMDLQMPEMDGLEATRRARGLGYGLPIIAMTANARREDRELCLAAGMDDYVSKPINPEALSQLLSGYLKPGMAPLPEPELEEEDFPPVEGVNCQAGLRRLGGNRRLYRSLLLQFARRQQNASQRLAVAPAAERQALVHTLKGAAANLGAERLADHCQRYEQGTLELTPLQQELERVIASALLLEQVEVRLHKSGKVVNQAKVTPLLVRLRQLLDQDLGEAFVTLEEVVQELEGTALAPQALQLKVWLEEFEVDQARALVDQLL